jgi:hypothetical protein
VNTFRKHLLPSAILLGVVVSPAWGETASCQPASVEIRRVSFAGAIEEREPADVPRSTAPGQDLYFFTEVSGAEGLRLLHRWTLNDQPLALVRLEVGGNRWRTWSQVRGADLKPGALRVTVESTEGCQLATQQIVVEDVAEPEATVAQASPAEPPAESVALEDQPPAEPVDEGESAAELAQRTQEALKLYEQAMRLREQERYTPALEQLDRAIELLPETAAETAKLRDERFYHTPLAKARYHLRQQQATELRQTLAPIRGYLHDHPQRFDYTRVLENYHKALYLLERSPAKR